MHNAQPISDRATHYRIKVRGRVDVERLQSFDSSAEISVDETRPMEEFTVLNVHTDQSGIVGLVWIRDPPSPLEIYPLIDANFHG